MSWESWFSRLPQKLNRAGFSIKLQGTRRDEVKHLPTIAFFFSFQVESSLEAVATLGKLMGAAADVPKE